MWNPIPKYTIRYRYRYSFYVENLKMQYILIISAPLTSRFTQIHPISNLDMVGSAYIHKRTKLFSDTEFYLVCFLVLWVILNVLSILIRKFPRNIYFITYCAHQIIKFIVMSKLECVYVYVCIYVCLCMYVYVSLWVCVFVCICLIIIIKMAP